MAIDFPNSPNNGDSFTSNDKTWQYNGTSWVVIAGSVSIDAGSVTASKLANNAVTSDKIAAGAVTAAKLGNDISLTPPDGSVTQAKLAASLSGVTVTTTANRSAAVPSPFTGQLVFLTDVTRLQVWNGSAWTFITNGAPGAPTSLSAAVLSPTSVSVAFTPGTINGASPTNYKYSLSTNGGSTYGEPTALDPADTVSPVTISGLTAGTTYHIKLRAVSDFGDSPDSTATSITTPALTVDYLVVAGGGSGGCEYGGGGGAGGLRSTVTATGGGGTLETALTLTASTNYSVQVGGGGASFNGNDTATAGNNGTNSVFSTITSIGGGGGGARYSSSVAPKSGGSGGGAGDNVNPPVYAGAAGTANQGYAGGGTTVRNYRGSGGGGAGGVGGNSASPTNGDGGVGVAVAITGSSVFYAGGGGGGEHSGLSTSGAGGNGGGGAGAYGNTSAVSGTANRGGGGGGGGDAAGAGTNTGGGGSGVVILRYPSSYTITIGAGLTGSTATDGAFKVTTITAGSGNVSWA